MCEKIENYDIMQNGSKGWFPKKETNRKYEANCLTRKLFQMLMQGKAIKQIQK